MMNKSDRALLHLGTRSLSMRAGWIRKISYTMSQCDSVKTREHLNWAIQAKVLLLQDDMKKVLQ